MTDREKLYALYCTYERETDGTWYWWPKDNLLIDLQDMPEPLEKVCRKWKEATKQGLFIKCNWLCFTWEKHQYVWYSPTRSAEEWRRIDSLISDLVKIGCTDILYEEGYLD